jgi:hypothetical protein
LDDNDDNGTLVLDKNKQTRESANINLPYKLVLLQRQGDSEGETKGKIFFRQWDESLRERMWGERKRMSGIVIISFNILKCMRVLVLFYLYWKSALTQMKGVILKKNDCKMKINIVTL